MFNQKLKENLINTFQINSVIEGEMLLAKADYYKTTDF